MFFVSFVLATCFSLAISQQQCLPERAQCPKQAPYNTVTQPSISHGQFKELVVNVVILLVAMYIAHRLHYNTKRLPGS